MTTPHLDVIVVGAGLSGVGAAYRLQTRSPRRTYAVFEARDAIGGTWDLFRYPGIRSDSDMNTLGYPFRPWTGEKSIADGASIRQYVRDTAREHGIERRIRFRHRVVAASWSSEDAAWTVRVEVGEDREVRTYTCSFLFLCTGYYRYDRGHSVDFPGREDFRGRVVHPQHWPADLDHTGHRVVVIGSGATAMTLVPAMAEEAEHVTMVQRSPGYVLSLPSRNPVAARLRRRLPTELAYRLIRGRSIALSTINYQLCRRFPRMMARVLRDRVAEQLPDSVPVDPAFTPRYAPWDQRLCVVPDADLFRALHRGEVSVVTDAAESFTEHGVRTASGAEIPADVVVTATGLEMLAFGGIGLTVDGTEIDPGRALAYKGMMFDGVPNLAWCVGYTNSSWTLRADLVAQYVCRLLNHMDRHGHAECRPVAGRAGAGERRPILDLSSNYVLRAADRMPKQGRAWPWAVRQNYLAELVTIRLGRVDDRAMRFRRAPRTRPSRRPATARR
ncbi:flavin-containing monooxygenase [Saccharopolyspora rosea]|uniref:Flavin-containing monooxygenase n=1 Tax=Saccharopolyspora rosea TaxID=524884 RepID=A0ABW3G415_9PSEU|nr:NAD(P)/FAD-dependent oxidoreductase [Saccharopolyspora rosea]